MTTILDRANAFQNVVALASAAEPQRIAAIRQQAAQRFSALGLPSSHDEEWKYTSLTALGRVDWAHATGATGETGALVDASMRGRAAAELVFVDGHLLAAASDIAALAGIAGVRLLSLRDALTSSEPLLERWFARLADTQRHPLTAMNTALAADGAVLLVDDGVVVDGFVHLLFIASGSDLMSHPRNLIVASHNSQLSVVETYVGSGRYFTNSVTEIAAGESAVISHTKLVREDASAFHIGTTQIHQERASSVRSHHMCVGGGLVRNEVNVALMGEGASLALEGLFVLTGKEHVDNHTVIDHATPHCDSQELFKGILDQQSRGIFDGRIIVRKDAQKTNSRQVNRNLLLSESAIVDSKPTLEIHADDVKCNHGSTIGQLDEEAIFYLRARGIDEVEARRFLIDAFASEIIDRLPFEPAREWVRRALFQQMPDRLPERREGTR
jgi:Fe-S cluster assembly protein SufD